MIFASYLENVEIFWNLLTTLTLHICT